MEHDAERLYLAFFFHFKAFLMALWSRTANNLNVSTGPLACLFAYSLAPLTRLLTPYCLLCSLTHFQACGMAVLAAFFLFRTIVKGQKSTTEKNTLKESGS